MIGYKNLNKDMSCRGFQYEIGETYHTNNIKLCENGFHFHELFKDLYSFYSCDDGVIVAEIDASGEIISGPQKSVCSTIKILRVLPHSEVLKKLNSGIHNSGIHNSGNRNSGNWNSGDCNSGDYNSGNRNSGNWNSGNWNSGYRNSGDCNSGNWNTINNSNGFFNTIQPTIIKVFNKDCDAAVWAKAHKPTFLYSMEFNKITKKDINDLKKLPNFDEKILEKSTGITIKFLENREILFRKF